MTDDRSAFTEARDAGLRARHETREARAVRRQVSGFIADLIDDYPGPDPSPRSPAWWAGYEEAKRDCALIARTFGSSETETRSCQPGCEFIAPHPSHPCGQYMRERP